MAYTKVAKPVGTTYSRVGRSPTNYPQYGSAIYGTSTYGKTNTYTSVSKPTGTTYTKVAKPT